MLLSLVDFVADLRDTFSDVESQAKQLSNFVDQEYSDANKRKVTRMRTDKESQASSLSPADKFQVNTFYVIIDKLVAELQKQSEAHDLIIQLFGFLTQLLFIETDVLEKEVANLVKVYSDDIEKDLSVELKQFISCLKGQPKGFFPIVQKKTQVQMMKYCGPLKVLNWLVDLDMIQVFPNTYIAYRILLTLPIANCESERSFSVLKRIKNIYRSTMSDDRLSSLTRLSIEVDLLRSIDFDDLIHDFARAKSRKKCF
ncbi:unnamed protein product [Parnassius mnemosyne]|uniref:HAT C-terminal dimerisation domain-containing protein n=1 Tax=Parnassius mnemosyne TaxID=213953 RepID=A0AAV1L8R8_9NEOP